MSDGLLQLLFFAFMAIQFGGAIVLYLRASRASRDYLHQFRSSEGYPLDGYSVVRGSPFNREMRQVFQEPQGDSELERLRRVARRRSGYFLLWWLGFPTSVAGVVVLILLLLHPPR